jgi:hypothetical protein
MSTQNKRTHKLAFLLYLTLLILATVFSIRLHFYDFLSLEITLGSFLYKTFIIGYLLLPLIIKKIKINSLDQNFTIILSFILILFYVLTVIAAHPIIPNPDIFVIVRSTELIIQQKPFLEVGYGIYPALMFLCASFKLITGLDTIPYVYILLGVILFLCVSFVYLLSNLDLRMLKSRTNWAPLLFLSSAALVFIISLCPQLLGFMLYLLTIYCCVKQLWYSDPQNKISWTILTIIAFMTIISTHALAGFCALISIVALYMSRNYRERTYLKIDTMLVLSLTLYVSYYVYIAYSFMGDFICNVQLLLDGEKIIWTIHSVSQVIHPNIITEILHYYKWGYPAIIVLISLYGMIKYWQKILPSFAILSSLGMTTIILLVTFFRYAYRTFLFEMVFICIFASIGISEFIKKYQIRHNKIEILIIFFIIFSFFCTYYANTVIFEQRIELHEMCCAQFLPNDAKVAASWDEYTIYYFYHLNQKKERYNLDSGAEYVMYWASQNTNYKIGPWINQSNIIYNNGKDLYYTSNRRR